MIANIRMEIDYQMQNGRLHWVVGVEISKHKCVNMILLFASDMDYDNSGWQKYVPKYLTI